MSKTTLLSVLFWVWLILLASIVFGLWVGHEQLEASLFTLLWWIWGLLSVGLLVVGIKWLSKRGKT